MGMTLRTGSAVWCQQTVSGAAAKQILGGDPRQASRILLKASTNTVFMGHNNLVTSGSGAQLPSGDAAPYLELWVDDPGTIFVVGSGTVYVIVEELSRIE